MELDLVVEELEDVEVVLVDDELEEDVDELELDVGKVIGPKPPTDFKPFCDPALVKEECFAANAKLGVVNKEATTIAVRGKILKDTFLLLRFTFTLRSNTRLHSGLR